MQVYCGEVMLYLYTCMRVHSEQSWLRQMQKYKSTEPRIAANRINVTACTFLRSLQLRQRPRGLVLIQSFDSHEQAATS